MIKRSCSRSEDIRFKVMWLILWRCVGNARCARGSPQTWQSKMTKWRVTFDFYGKDVWSPTAASLHTISFAFWTMAWPLEEKIIANKVCWLFSLSLCECLVVEARINERDLFNYTVKYYQPRQKVSLGLSHKRKEVFIRKPICTIKTINTHTHIAHIRNQPDQISKRNKGNMRNNKFVIEGFFLRFYVDDCVCVCASCFLPHRILFCLFWTNHEPFT